MLRRLALALAALAAVVLLPPRFAPAPDPAELPKPGRRVELGGGQWLNVEERGTGAPVVLVHGLPSNLGDWAGLPERLAAEGLRAIAYDRLGFGLSSRPDPDPGRYTYESNARELAALLDALALERASLVGWSYGGGVATRFASERPERLERLVLLSSVGPSTGGGDALEVFFSSEFLLEWVAGVRPLAGRVVAANVARAFSGEAAVPPGWVERTRAMLALPGTLRSFALENARHRGVPLEPERIRAPTLVVCGSADRDTPLPVSEDLARRIPGARLEVIPDGSHMLPVTHADALARAIAGFVRGEPQRSELARGRRAARVVAAGSL
jgi:pimeloyl-ACP methyl ester carboxylesterase